MITKTPIRIRFAETDQMGIAHHSAYVIWLELARVEWLRQHGLSYRDMETSGLSLAVSKLELNYRNSARFDDEIIVETRLSEVKSRKVTFTYQIRNKHKLLLTAYSVHIPMGQDKQAIRMPKDYLEKLQAYVDKMHS